MSTREKTKMLIDSMSDEALARFYDLLVSMYNFEETLDDEFCQKLFEGSPKDDTYIPIEEAAKQLGVNI